jgi:hypothetical protein
MSARPLRARLPLVTGDRVAWPLWIPPGPRAVTRLENMTSDTAKPETKPQAKPETFRSHLPAIVAATTGTVLAAVLGSLIGTAGTIVGMVIGSLSSGTCSWWAERGIRRSAALATARAETLRSRGYHMHPGDHYEITAAAAGVTRAEVTQAGGTRAGGTRAEVRATGASRHGRPGRSRRWAGPAAFIVAAFIGCAIVITLMEGAAGKPLSAVVQGKPGHGTTLGGGTVGKAAPASPSPKPSASPSPTSSASTTAPAATSTAPSRASSSPASSTAPATTAPASTSPVTGTPSPATPAATPTGTTPTGTTPTGTATAG